MRLLRLFSWQLKLARARRERLSARNDQRIVNLQRESSLLDREGYTAQRLADAVDRGLLLFQNSL